ncbi:MAG: 60S ribosomal protein L31 [Thaumarchaeota archaeon]|nr:60S ribosomal protein L31 [Nitrososphaerota archaeon]
MNDLSKHETELERVYTVPLTRAWITARHRRTRRAINILREFAEKHMKSSEIKIDTDLNEEIWKRGITKPPRRITVKMEKDEDGVVTISLPKAAKKEAAVEPVEVSKEEEIVAEPVKPTPPAEPVKVPESKPREEKAPKKPRKTGARKKAEKS